MVLGLAAFWPGSHFLPLLIPYVGGYLLFCFALTPVAGIKNISRRGDISYGIYLYAFPLQRILLHHFEANLTPLMLAVFASLLTTVFATLSWFLVERPCLSLKPHTSPRTVKGGTPELTNPAAHPSLDV